MQEEARPDNEISLNQAVFPRATKTYSDTETRMDRVKRQLLKQRKVGKRNKTKDASFVV